MKNLLSRLTLLTLLVFMSIPATLDAQYRHGRPQTRRNYNSGDGFYRAMRNAETVGHAAMFGAFLHHLDDYTGFRLGYMRHLCALTSASQMLPANLLLALTWALSSVGISRNRQ